MRDCVVIKIDRTYIPKFAKGVSVLVYRLASELEVTISMTASKDGKISQVMPYRQEVASDLKNSYSAVGTREISVFYIDADVLGGVGDELENVDLNLETYLERLSKCPSLKEEMRADLIAAAITGNEAELAIFREYLLELYEETEPSIQVAIQAHMKEQFLTALLRKDLKTLQGLQGKYGDATTELFSHYQAEVAELVAVAPKVHTFTLEAPGAEQVYLVGSFNDWLNATSDGVIYPADTQWALSKVEGTDTWQITVDLVPGDYAFKFVVDGRWVTTTGLDKNEEVKVVPSSSFGETVTVFRSVPSVGDVVAASLLV